MLQFHATADIRPPLVASLAISFLELGLISNMRARHVRLQIFTPSARSPPSIFNAFDARTHHHHWLILRRVNISFIIATSLPPALFCHTSFSIYRIQHITRAATYFRLFLSLGFCSMHAIITLLEMYRAHHSR